MLFNSLIFLAFFAIVYTLYLLSRRWFRVQNVLLLVASYVFYGWWDWRFLSLIAISTVIDYTVGRALGSTDDAGRRKILVTASVVSNLSILGFFKYFNFFADSAVRVFGLVGLQADPITLNIILPVGISFYTFQTMSYTIDVYRRQMEPTRNFIDFAVFVAFFPQLVAGPIERAKNLLPQFAGPRTIRVDEVNAGLYLILWGYFKKVVIADNMAVLANKIFNTPGYEGIDLIIGVLAFSVQIYGDFSGYSDIARGLAKLMGLVVMVNFRLPYFALNPSDFWERWHISLSSWLRDYLYIPLGGNRGTSFATYRNLALTMLLGGLWHGAAWTFVIWGAFHGAILIIYRRFDRNPEHLDPWGGEYSYVRVGAKLLLMFTLTLVGWVIFRAESVEQIVYFLTQWWGPFSAEWKMNAYDLAFFTLPLVIVQIAQYVTNDLLILTKLRTSFRVAIHSFFLLWILLFGVRESTEFIYFQF